MYALAVFLHLVQLDGTTPFLHFSSPVVHLEPLHPVVHKQELGALQVPPFGQDVDPKHKAETDNKISIHM